MKVDPLKQGGRYLFSDTPMSACAEGLVWALSPLAHSAKPVVNLLPILVRVLLERLLCLALRVVPPRRVPFGRIRPQLRVDLADGRACKDVVAFRYDVLAVFGRRCECRRDDEVGADIAHDTVNRRVHAEGLADDSVEHGKRLDLVIGRRAERTVRVQEMLHLLLIKGLTSQ